MKIKTTQFPDGLHLTHKLLGKYNKYMEAGNKTARDFF